MDPNQFSKNSPGRLVLIPERVHAFVPEALPQTVSFQPETIKLLSQADRAMGQLEGVAQMLPNPHLLVRPFLRREAEMSSRIEGTYATQKELVLFDIAKIVEEERSDVLEVANYV